jgi:hypothetical protein
MNKKYFAGLASLALAAVCAAQSVVPPPPDCLAAARANQQAVSGCPPPTPALGGGGTPGVVPVFTSASTIGNSVITQSASGSVESGRSGDPSSRGRRHRLRGNVSVSGNVATGDVTAANLSVSGVSRAHSLTWAPPCARYLREIHRSELAPAPPTPVPQQLFRSQHRHQQRGQQQLGIRCQRRAAKQHRRR